MASGWSVKLEGAEYPDSRSSSRADGLETNRKPGGRSVALRRLRTQSAAEHGEFRRSASWHGSSARAPAQSRKRDRSCNAFLGLGESGSRKAELLSLYSRPRALSLFFSQGKYNSPQVLSVTTGPRKELVARVRALENIDLHFDSWRKWNRMTEKLRRLVFRFPEGLPSKWRGRVWFQLLVRESGFHGFENVPSKELTASFLDTPLDELNQSVIKTDVNRTRAHLAEFKSSELRHTMEKILTFVCKRKDLKYKQGLNEILAPFLFIKSDGFGIPEAVKSFSAFVSRFLPLFADDDFQGLQCTFFLFQQLLVYHDPELGSYLAHHSVAPELYVTPWFLTLFASKTQLNLLVYLWDLYIAENDSTLACFIGLALLLEHRYIILEIDVFSLPEVLTQIGFGDYKHVNETWNLAIWIRDNTPPSFATRISRFYMSPARCQRALPVLERDPVFYIYPQEVVMHCYRVTDTDLLNANIVPLSVPRGGTWKLLILDLRRTAQYNAGHLPGALSVDLVDATWKETFFSVFTRCWFSKALWQEEYGKAVMSPQSSGTLNHCNQREGDSVQEDSFGSVFETYISMLSAPLHLCVLSTTGNESQAKAVYQHFSNTLGIARISFVLGGYAAVHKMVSQLGVELLDHNPEACISCVSQAQQKMEMLFQRRTTVGPTVDIKPSCDALPASLDSRQPTDSAWKAVDDSSPPLLPCTAPSLKEGLIECVPSDVATRRRKHSAIAALYQLSGSVSSLLALRRGRTSVCASDKLNLEVVSRGSSKRRSQLTTSGSNPGTKPIFSRAPYFLFSSKSGSFPLSMTISKEDWKTLQKEFKTDTVQNIMYPHQKAYITQCRIVAILVGTAPAPLPEKTPSGSRVALSSTTHLYMVPETGVCKLIITPQYITVGASSRPARSTTPMSFAGSCKSSLRESFCRSEQLDEEDSSSGTSSLSFVSSVECDNDDHDDGEDSIASEFQGSRTDSFNQFPSSQDPNQHRELPSNSNEGVHRSTASTSSLQQEKHLESSPSLDAFNGPFLGPPATRKGTTASSATVAPSVTTTSPVHQLVVRCFRQYRIRDVYKIGTKRSEPQRLSLFFTPKTHPKPRCILDFPNAATASRCSAQIRAFYETRQSHNNGNDRC